jgi:RimJ/RimL family protein N-acetyltransferase
VSERPEPAVGWFHPVVQGDLVLVRAPAVGDEPALVEMSTDPQVRRYVGGPLDLSTAQSRAARKVAEPRWGHFVIVDRASDTVAGSGSLARKRGPWEISYQLRRAWWGRGLAGESVSLIRDWFFTRMGEDLLIATTQRVNVASRRLLQRAGATHAGSLSSTAWSKNATSSAVPYRRPREVCRGLLLAERSGAHQQKETCDQYE